MAAGPAGRRPAFLRLRVIDDAVVVPRARFGDVSLGAGVLKPTAHGQRPVRDTGVRRRDKEYVLPPPVDSRPRHHIDQAIFGGYLFDHYGHFLLESLGRLWFDEPRHDIPIVWIAATADRWRPWMTELADLVGIGPHRRLLNAGDGPLGVGRLVVADQGFEVDRYMHPWLVDRLAIVPASPDVTGNTTGHSHGHGDGHGGTGHVWLSRTGLDETAGVAEERDIERRLADSGWAVVHPERLTVAEQVRVLRSARHVAGIEGSAFHTLLLLRGFTGTVDLLSRHGSRNFEVINAAQRLDLQRHDLVGGMSRAWQRPNGSRDVSWSGVDVDATVRMVLSTCARHT